MLLGGPLTIVRGINLSYTLPWNPTLAQKTRKNGHPTAEGA